MKIVGASVLAGIVGCAAIGSGALLMLPARAETPPGVLASHRAVYELTLGHAHGTSASSTVAARGRILYDFAGSACEGYKLEFRQVSVLDNGEGRETVSDLRSDTLEGGDFKSYRFKSQNYRNSQLVESVEGEAVRQADRIAVTLTKPKEAKIGLDQAIAFPTEHVRKIIEAARAGTTILQLPVYDGSESGEKVYNTLSIIGRVIGPGERVPTDAAAGQAALAGLKRWPVTVSYFDRSSKAGEQMPVYAISFELYENGISRALILDYNDFSIRGELTSLEIRDTKPCP